jgi:hypothetical protein
MREPDNIGHCFEPFVCCCCFEPQVLNHTDYRETLPGWRKRIDLPKGRVITFPTSRKSASESEPGTPQRPGVVEGRECLEVQAGEFFLLARVEGDITTTFVRKNIM